ncbi:MAG: hypothetical protein JST65_10900, partial [Acidobacteria bacterium]|nr:hypothetical protein [Acidobacteriota bacterium]
MKKQFTATILASSLMFAQAPAAKPAAPSPAKPAAAPVKPVAAAPAKAVVSAPAKPAAAAAAAKPALASGVDTVIQLVKAKRSEEMIVKMLRAGGKAYSLTPQDMLKLTDAGVSDNIINVMMDPKAELAAAPVPAPA